MPIKVAKSEQACALGAAMFAAVVAGIHPSIKEAQAAMGQGFTFEYQPNMDNHGIYMSIYKKYQKLGKVTDSESF